MYRVEPLDPPLIVCQVGGTKLLYDGRAISDLHAWLMAHGDWMPLGGADEQKTAPKHSRGLGPVCYLRLLKRAGLVVEQPLGTRRMYHLHDQGVEAVRAYVERVWGDAAARFRLVARNTPPT